MQHDSGRSTGPRHNLELKVQMSPAELAVRREWLLAAGGGPLTRLRQVDTYFRVPAGRLKLREIEAASGVSAELIAYQRPDDAEARWSAYECVPITPAAVAALKRGLTATLGELVRVEKVREIGVLGHSRIHLDAVRELGTFLEIETVVSDQNPATAPAELAEVVERLRLGGFPPIGESYSDLRRRRAVAAPRPDEEDR